MEEGRLVNVHLMHAMTHIYTTMRACRIGLRIIGTQKFPKVRSRSKKPIVCKSTLTPPLVGKEQHFYRLIGVFRLCAGDDRLDVLPVGGLDPQLRDVLRRRPGLDTLDDNRRAVLAGAPASRHVHRRARQLDGQLSRGHRLPQHEGEWGIFM